jgi:hypothetical protein
MVAVVFVLVSLVGGLMHVGELIVRKAGCCCEDEMLCDDAMRLEEGDTHGVIYLLSGHRGRGCLCPCPCLCSCGRVRQYAAVG